MNRAVLLDVAAILNNNLTPVSSKGTSGTDIHIPANGDVTGNSSLGMNKSSGVGNGFDAVEFVKHEGKLRIKNYEL